VGRSFALILTGVTPIAALETRPRLRMGTSEMWAASRLAVYAA
jgi:hypothetical protein